MYQRMIDLPGTSGYWKHPPLPQHSTATVHLPPGWSGYLKHPPVPDPARVHTAMTTALNGWQITLIAVGAALLAAAISLLVRRAPWAEPQDADVS
jgi:hypothetical protein